jgi:hypothetical protein
MQQSIADLSEEVNSVSSNPMDKIISRLSPSVQNSGFGRAEVRKRKKYWIGFLFDDDIPCFDQYRK